MVLVGQRMRSLRNLRANAGGRHCRRLLCYFSGARFALLRADAGMPAINAQEAIAASLAPASSSVCAYKVKGFMHFLLWELHALSCFPPERYCRTEIWHEL
jgi:hypothetical protein